MRAQAVKEDGDTCLTVLTFLIPRIVDLDLDAKRITILRVNVQPPAIGEGLLSFISHERVGRTIRKAYRVSYDVCRHTMSVPLPLWSHKKHNRFQRQMKECDTWTVEQCKKFLGPATLDHRIVC